MTEEEAKTKWCPMARVSTLIEGLDYNQTAVGGAACNRPAEGNNMMSDNALCIASDCMLWREKRAFKEFKEPIYNSNGNICGYNADTEVIGYCGLGGKP